MNTAGKIREAQITPASDGSAAKTVPDVLQLPVLMEQDFGSMEGEKFHDRTREWEVSRKWNKDNSGFVRMESKDTMAHRADFFLNEHLMPLLDDTSKDMHPVVAIVSHGIFLSMLWKRLLLQLPSKGVMLSPKLELRTTARPSLKHLGGWSNTGYLELHLQRSEAEEHSPSRCATLLPVSSSSPAEMPTAHKDLGEVEVPETASSDILSTASDTDSTTSVVAVPLPASISCITQGWSCTILKINGKDHLQGLKRTGGGVGSARYDASQKSIHAFYKRRRIE